MLSLARHNGSVNAIDDTDDIYPIDFRIIARHQQDCQATQQLLQKPGYETKNIHGPDLIFYNKKIVIPPTLVDRIILWYHEHLNHPGIERTYKRSHNTSMLEAWKRVSMPCYVVVLARKINA